MTNEEKATYIANANQCIDRSGHSSFYECKDSALQMAEWKDQQFKDAINSILDYFDRGREAGFVSENSYNDMKYFASKVINKIFKEEEK